MQLGRGETIEDTARVLAHGRCDRRSAPTATEDVEALAMASSAVPVVNGLSDAGHPARSSPTLMTFEEHHGALEGKTLAWVGDGNNKSAQASSRPRPNSATR